MIARITLFGVAVALVCAAGTASEPAPAAAPAPAPTVKAEPIDVLYLSDARPVAVRFQITTDGKPLGETWGRFADALFTKLDADKSGSLDEKELAKFRPMLSLLVGRNMPADTSPRAPLTRDGLAAYLRQNDLGPLRLPRAAAYDVRVRSLGYRRGGGLTPEVLDNAIMELLDTNTDKKLSVAELTAGVEILRKLDNDENEMVSTDELLRRTGAVPYYIEEFDGRAMREVAGPGVELLTLGRKPDPNLAKRLLARYGPKPKPPDTTTPTIVKGLGTSPAPVAPESTARRLTIKELKISPEIFEALDQDGDGELDTEELARFGQSASPEVEIAFRLGTIPRGAKAAEVVKAGKAPVKAFAGPGGTEVALEVPGVRLDLTLSETTQSQWIEVVPPLADGTDTPRSAFHLRYLNRFRAFDRDANGYLEVTEAGGDAVFRDLFAFLDADKDGKLFEKELVTALDEVEPISTAAAGGMVSIDVREAGRGLLGLLDADGDGRISVRELRAMSKLVERFDSDKDGFLSPTEVPRRFQATLSRGLTNLGTGPRAVAFVPGGYQGTPRPPVGPVWFQKMDRNRDGDVSRREFLGADEDFRKIDKDADDLISAQEAEAAKPK